MVVMATIETLIPEEKNVFNFLCLKFKKLKIFTSSLCVHEGTSVNAEKWDDPSYGNEGHWNKSVLKNDNQKKLWLQNSTYQLQWDKNYKILPVSDDEDALQVVIAVDQ